MKQQLVLQYVPRPTGLNYVAKDYEWVWEVTSSDLMVIFWYVGHVEALELCMSHEAKSVDLH